MLGPPDHADVVSDGILWGEEEEVETYCNRCLQFWHLLQYSDPGCNCRLASHHHQWSSYRIRRCWPQSRSRHSRHQLETEILLVAISQPWCMYTRMHTSQRRNAGGKAYQRSGLHGCSSDCLVASASGRARVDSLRSSDQKILSKMLDEN